MRDLFLSFEFWVAMLFAVVMKLRASPSLTKVSAAITTLAAVSGALVFTGPAHAWLGLAGDGSKAAVAALVALTCEHVARLLMQMSIKDALDLWRGK